MSAEIAAFLNKFRYEVNMVFSLHNNVWPTGLSLLKLIALLLRMSDKME